VLISYNSYSLSPTLSSPVMTMTTTNLLLFADTFIWMFPYTGSMTCKRVFGTLSK